MSLCQPGCISLRPVFSEDSELNFKGLRFIDPESRDWMRTDAALAEVCRRWETMQLEQRIELLGLLRFLQPSENAVSIINYSLAVNRGAAEKAMTIRLLGTWGRTSRFHREYLDSLKLPSMEAVMRYTMEELRFYSALVESKEPLEAVLIRSKDNISSRFAMWTLVMKITENAQCLYFPDEVLWFSRIMKTSTRPADDSGPSQLIPADLFSASWASSHLANSDSTALREAAIAIYHGLYGSSHTGRVTIRTCPAALPLMDANSASREVASALLTAENWSPQSYS